MPTSDDIALIQRAKTGSQEAMDALFRRYGTKLLSLIRLRMGASLRNQLESQDLLQQTMLKAFERMDQFAGAGEMSLMGWMGAIARNEIRDHVKYIHRGGRDVAKNVPFDAVGDAVLERVRTEVSRLHLAAQTQALERAVESLDEHHREVLLLRRFEELTFPQIGARLEKSPDACRMLYARAMAALTFKLQEMSGEA